MLRYEIREFVISHVRKEGWNVRVKVKIITLKDPCSACFIIGGLVKEIFEKLQKEIEFINVEYIELEDLKKLHDIAGLEVEGFPAIMINGEQITAGTVPNRKEIVSRIQWECENNEY